MYSGVQMSQNSAIMSAEQLQHAAQQKKARGATEENDPEYAKLLTILRYYQSVNRPQPVGGLSQQQLNQLRYQTQSYKHLASGEQIPSLLQQSVLGLTEQQQPQNVAAKVVDATLKTAVPPIQSQPMQRQEYLKARVDWRIKELSSMPAEKLSGREKMNALIELKSLQLLEKQQKLRKEILDSVSKSSTLATALDRSSFRRMKKQSLREARQTEKQERALRGEKDKRERQKHLDYINSILAHGRDFMTHHRTVQARHQKLGAAVLRFHAAAMREEELRKSRHSQERLKALKSNDEEAYLRLLDKTKDTRITTILEQTNSFLAKLTNAVETQKTSVDMQIDTSTITKNVNANGEVEEDDPDMPRDYYSTAHRIQEIVTEQSSLLVGGTLKEYQIKGLQWMVSLYNNRLNGILADEMGLGKTIQTLSLITYLIEKKRQPGPFLVIVPLSTMTNWVLEFDKWAPSVTKIVYKGSPDTRKNLSMQVRQGNFNVLLTTFEYIINPKDRPTLSKIKWVHMIIDEGHRLKNSGSRLAVTLMQHYTSRYRLILTGTPLQNNLPELWALLNFILPKIFNSVKSFDEWFNSPFTSSSINEKIELNEEEQLLIIRRLHKVLRPFLLRRLKKDVESELPDKVEIVIKCPMSALQKRLTDQIKSRKYNIEGFANKPKKALSNLVMQFRKICNHPYVFTEVEDTLNPQHITDRNLFRVAGKFELLDRILDKFKSRDHRVLMFFQMTAIMDIMEDYLRWKGFTYLRLDGNTKADDRTDMLKKFNSNDDPPFIFLLSTRAGGLGLNLQSADTVIIYDSDWNPHQDLQAQDRAHRIGQKKEVRILRLITAKSVEENILARAQYKLDIDGKVIQAGKFDNKTTDREREELLRSLFGADEDDDEVLDGDEPDKKVSKEGEWMPDSELNEIIARNEEELEHYNKMDEERRALEKQQHEDYGNAGPVPHRLMQDSELPEVFLVDVNVPDEPKIDLPTGRGARNRKDIQYQIPTEEEFDEVIDDGVDVGGFLKREEARKAESKAKKERKAEDHRKRRAAGEEVDSDADAYEDVPDDPMELPDPDGTNAEAVNPSKRTNDDGSPSAKKKKKAKKHFAGVDPDMPETLDPATRQTFTTIFQACYKAVEELEVEEEGYVRRRSELFLELPDRNTYADYYKVILNPIAMDMIAHRINSPYYTSLQAFAEDFGTMFKNAMTYNVEGSEVYQDAFAMQNVFNQTLQRHAQSLQKPAQPRNYPPQQFPVQSSHQFSAQSGNQFPVQSSQQFPVQTVQPQYQQQYPGQQYPQQQLPQYSGQQLAQQPAQSQHYPQNLPGFPQ